jgi:hypothetical protein
MPVPWLQLVKFAPQIISLSRELLNRTRGTAAAADPEPGTDVDDLARRIEALEENERNQAELVDRMAQQQAKLAQAVVTLHRRQRVLIGAVVVLAIALLWQIAVS